jgi:hypothetical protein
MNFYIKQLLRILEKIPGLCLLQVANFGDVKILMLPKIGTRSIRNSLIRFHYGSATNISKSHAWHHITYHTRKSLNNELKSNEGKILVFLREPDKRIASCWRQKISVPESVIPYFIFYFPYLYPRMSYLKFVDRILKIPVPLMEKHFIPVSYLIGKLDLENLYLNRLEKLNDVLKELDPDGIFEHANSTQSTGNVKGSEVLEIKNSSVYIKDYALWQSTQPN